MSHQMVSRAERWANGASTAQIASEDGVTPPRVLNALHGVIYKAGRQARPQSALPTGLKWTTNMAGEPYVTAVHSGRPIQRDQVRWALAVLRSTTAAVCECCGRQL